MDLSRALRVSSSACPTDLTSQQKSRARRFLPFSSTALSRRAKTSFVLEEEAEKFHFCAHQPRFESFEHGKSGEISRCSAGVANSPLSSHAEKFLGYSVVMKFGGSSLADADRMRKVAELIQSFEDEMPIIVLSAMGKTTNNLLKAGETAITCEANDCKDIHELGLIKELHLSTARELGVDNKCVNELLQELTQLLTGIAFMKEVTPRARDYLVSFGEKMSTRLFSAYLNKTGTKARQYDAFDLGFTTTDDFTNADILEETYPAVSKRLTEDFNADPAIAVVTGFLGKGKKSGAVTTLGRGGSDLTATAIGRALTLREIQVWKDVDGVLTSDPRICPKAKCVPSLTFDEAAELAFFGAQVLHPQSMLPAREANIPVRVRNSYRPESAGTLIESERDMSSVLLTSIVLKRNVTLLDIVSLRMLGHFGFLAKVFSIFEELGISVDVVATSEVSISLTLDPAKIWSRELIPQESERMVERLKEIAVVNLVPNRSVISLIGNVQKTPQILQKVFTVFQETGTNVEMISQGASKVNISLVVDDERAQEAVQNLHKAFFEDVEDISTQVQNYRTTNGVLVQQ